MSAESSDPQEPNLKPARWLGIISAVLTATNTIIATAGLGLLQGLVVPFTTPFAFALGRLLFPRLPTATLIYLPLVLVSMFTLNLGPIPGPQKLLFLIAPIAYDIVGFFVRCQNHTFTASPPKWKLLSMFAVYPFGLLAAALLLERFFSMKSFILEKGMAAAWGGVAFFEIVGVLATLLAYRVFARAVRPVLSENA